MKEVVEEINKSSKNSRYLKECKLPERVKATLKIEDALKDAEMVVIAVPSHAVRIVSNKVSKYIASGTIITSVAKGIEQGSLKRMSEIIEEEIVAEEPVLEKEEYQVSVTDIHEWKEDLDKPPEIIVSTPKITGKKRFSRKMNIGIIRFPGTNNEVDTFQVLKSFGVTVRLVEHNEIEKKLDKI